MSANNWTFCPKCQKTKKEESIALDENVKISYGKIAVEEWLKLRDEADEFRDSLDSSSDMTLREDWSIGTYNQKFSVSYSSGCSQCNYSYDYNHETKELL